MPDMDYVIKELKYLHDRETWKEGPLVSDDHAEDRRKITADAIAMLKAQEPVKAYRLHGEKVIDNGEKVFTGQCDNCFCYLVDGWKACPVCGRKVKWE